MSTIALKAALATDTGTGKSFTDWDLSGPIASFREVSPAGPAGELKFKRRDPKPSKDYAGATGGEVKLTRQVADSQGRLWPQILTITSSQPAFLSDADKTAFVLEGTLAIRESVSQVCLSTGKVPQS